MINFKVVVCLAATLLLTACDPLGFLDDDSNAASGDKSRTGPRWKCVEVFSPDSFLCTLGNQSVTVELENVIVPGSISQSNKKEFEEEVSLSPKSLKKYVKEANVFASNLLFNMDVSLSPFPKKNARKCIARVTVIPGGDVEARLLNEGLAMLKHDVKPEVEDKYMHYQQKALDYADGFWSQCVANTNNFAINVTVSLSSAYEKKVTRKTIKNLPKYHSPDLYNGPKFTEIEASSIEDISNTDMKLTAEALIKINSAPKLYELTLRIRPRVIQKELSGPLSTFKKAVLEWEENTISAKGGERVHLITEYPPVEISRVIKGNNVSIFTGAIIESCDVELLSDGKVIYQSKKELPREMTLSKLDGTTSVSF